MQLQFDSSGSDLWVICNLIGRDEAYTKATDVLTAIEFSTAADIRDSVVVTLVITFGKKRALLVQIAAVSELPAIKDHKTLICDVKNHRLRFCVVRVLN
ncbi:hypothetical protein D3C73_822410 [compost metagenome]